MAKNQLSKQAMKNLLPFLLLLVGVILIYGSIKNESPIKVVKSIVSGGNGAVKAKKAAKNQKDAGTSIGEAVPNSFTPGPDNGTGGTVQAI
jgi:hypothetical protein